MRRSLAVLIAILGSATVALAAPAASGGGGRAVSAGGAMRGAALVRAPSVSRSGPMAPARVSPKPPKTMPPELSQPAVNHAGLPLPPKVGVGNCSLERIRLGTCTDVTSVRLR